MLAAFREGAAVETARQRHQRSRVSASLESAGVEGGGQGGNRWRQSGTEMETFGKGFRQMMREQLRWLRVVLRQRRCAGHQKRP